MVSSRYTKPRNWYSIVLIRNTVLVPKCITIKYVREMIITQFHITRFDKSSAYLFQEDSFTKVHRF